MARTKHKGGIWSSCGVSSAMLSSSAVMPSFFAITFEFQCAIEHVYGVKRGITYIYVLRTYFPVWRAVQMLSVAVYEKIYCTLRLQPSKRTPHGTTHST